MKKSTDSQQAPTIPLAAQNQSRLLPSWPPLHRCVVDGCDQSGAFDRPDGSCYFHAKMADGLFTNRRRSVLKTCGKFPWDEWFDGNEHVVHPAAKFSVFRRQAREAAERRGLVIVVSHAGETSVSLQAMLEAA